MIALASDAGICVLEFLNRRSAAAAGRMFATRLGAVVETGTSTHIGRLRRELSAYFAGRRRRFRVPLDLRGTPFQKIVWARLRHVPYGATRSYAAIAASIGKPSAFRAVGHANGRNPVAIVVPCHRLVGGAGELRGYGGGLWRKERLLAFEKRGSPWRRKEVIPSDTSPRSSRRSRRARRSGR